MPSSMFRAVAVAVAAVLAVAGLSSCTADAPDDVVRTSPPAANSSRTSEPPDELIGTSWVWEGPPGADYNPHFLTFTDDETIVVYAYCNSMTFTWAGLGTDDIDVTFHSSTDVG